MPIAEVMLWDWVTFGNLSINCNIILCDNNLLLNFNNGIWYLQDYIIKLNILILDSTKKFWGYGRYCCSGRLCSKTNNYLLTRIIRLKLVRSSQKFCIASINYLFVHALFLSHAAAGFMITVSLWIKLKACLNAKNLD